MKRTLSFVKCLWCIIYILCRTYRFYKWWEWAWLYVMAKRSKIPKGWSEVVTRRKTDNQIAKKKKTKNKTTNKMVHKTLHRKLMFEQYGNTKKTGRKLWCSSRVRSACYNSSTRRIDVWLTRKQMNPSLADLAQIQISLSSEFL